MTKLHTVQKFALADTYIATENVRAETVHDAEALKALAGSIRHFGRLLEPLKAYIDDEGRAAVWDGGRRHTALRLIEADADGVGRVITDAVDVFVTTKEEAAEASLATFVREDMHPADQFLAYNAAFDRGMTPEQIAAAFAVETKTVSQLLRFRTLAPEVLDAFRAGRFGLDVCYAFTLTTDHDKQRALLEGGGDLTQYGVKRALTEGAVTARDKWARFIGREAYEAAGGTFLMDLFSNHSADEQWSNGDLVRELAQRKLRETEEALLAEGWGKVIVSQDAYGWQGGYTAMKAEGPTKKGQPRAFTKEQMAQGVVFIVFGWEEHEIKKGYQKEAKGPAPVSKAKEDPEMFGWGHNGHHVMTQVATDITKVALASNPAAAADAMLIQLAWSVLRKPTYGTAARSLASSMVPESTQTSRPEHVAVKGLFDMNCDLKAWGDRLPKAQVAFFDAVAALGPDEKLQLQAICYASTLDAVETKNDLRRLESWRHLGWMARHAGVGATEIADAWTPEADFLKGGSKDALLSVLDEVKPKSLVHAKGWPNAKKAELVECADRYVADARWSPKLLATFTDVKDPEPVVRPVLGDTPAEDAEDRDAQDENEYLGWIEEALCEMCGVGDGDAYRMARAAREAEKNRSDQAEVGHPDYSWTRADALTAATDHLADEADAADA